MADDTLKDEEHRHATRRDDLDRRHDIDRRMADQPIEPDGREDQRREQQRRSESDRRHEE